MKQHIILIQQTQKLYNDEFKHWILFTETLIQYCHSQPSRLPVPSYSASATKQQTELISHSLLAAVAATALRVSISGD